MSWYDAQFNAYNVNTNNFKYITDATDAANVYVWYCSNDKLVSDINKAQRFIKKITKVWEVTTTWLVVWWKDNWSSVWANRASYTYL